MLNDITVKNAIPREKIFRIFDEKGLYIRDRPNHCVLFTTLWPISEHSCGVFL
ncbi:MAG: hypothetical protein ACI9IL_000022 [Rickettsiales bacterium]|jgi:hypothetical protein